MCVLSGTLQLIIRGRVQHKHVFVPRWQSNSSRFDPGQMNGEEGRRPAPGGRGRSGWAAARGCAGRWPGCGACPWLGVAARGRCGPPPGFLRGRIYFRQGWGWGEGRRRRRRGAVEPWVEERARWHQRTGRARREEGEPGSQCGSRHAQLRVRNKLLLREVKIWGFLHMVGNVLTPCFV